MNIDLFTPTQQRILRFLSDGRPHLTAELKQCLADELGSRGNVRHHVSNTRKVLNAVGEDIVCVTKHYKFYYQWVKLRGRAAKGEAVTQE